MASILKVDTIQDQAGNNIINENANVITIGASGDTITIPSGASMSGFSSTGIDDNATSTAITIDSSQNVGIGTTTPSVKLEIKGTENDADTQAIRLMENATQGGFIKYDGNVNELKLGGFNSGENTGIRIARNDATTYFNTNGLERMVINSSGNVGIGTSSPQTELHVVDSAGAVAGASYRTSAPLTLERTGGVELHMISDDSGYGQLRFGDASSTMQGALQYDHSANAMLLYTSGSERMRINSSGSVGIGTSSPGTVPLNVVTTDSGNVDDILELRNNATTSGTGVRLRLVSSTDVSSVANSVSISSYRNAGSNHDILFESSGSERMRITSSGHVIAPNLNTTGTTSNRYPLYWVHNGTVGSIEPYTGSIRAMKTDINDMGSVNWIHSLRPRSFKFRDYETDEDGNRTYLETTNNEPSTEYGLIAEEVNEVSGSDYILDKDENNNVKGVLYHNLVPVLLKAVQEQKNTIQELEARITALETNNP